LRQDGQAEVELPTEDAFQRLMAHGLASFHGLQSFSRDAASGQGRSVTVRKPEGGPGAGREPGQAPPAVTCADILFALEEQPAGMTPALLADFMSVHGSDRSSEASYVML
jgi:hypothetical protein